MQNCAENLHTLKACSREKTYSFAEDARGSAGKTMRSCTARVRVMHRGFSHGTRLSQRLRSARLPSGWPGFSHRVLARGRHTASAQRHAQRPHACRVRTASSAGALGAHGRGAPRSGATPDRSGRRPVPAAVAATVGRRPCHGGVGAVAVANARACEATRPCGTLGPAPAAAASPRPVGPTW
jgi:hypothetical protein